MPNLGGWELVILVGVLVLLFGAKKLPDMARSIGQSARVFKGEMKGLKDDGKETTSPPPAPPAAVQPSPLPAPEPVVSSQEPQAHPAQPAPGNTGQ